jgi:hypothetical protein
MNDPHICASGQGDENTVAQLNLNVALFQKDFSLSRAQRRKKQSRKAPQVQ